MIRDAARSNQVDFYDNELGLERRDWLKHGGSLSWRTWCCRQFIEQALVARGWGI